MAKAALEKCKANLDVHRHSYNYFNPSSVNINPLYVTPICPYLSTTFYSLLHSIHPKKNTSANKPGQTTPLKTESLKIPTTIKPRAFLTEDVPKHSSPPALILSRLQT
jgi:hypothetical protein